MKVLAWTVLFVLQASAAAAQLTPRPIPRFVADVRGFYLGLNRDPVTAADLGVVPDDLPGRAPGGVAGIHLYPVRTSSFALGIGGEAILARGRAQRTTEDGTIAGPAVTQRLRGLSGAISLNFGHRDGWSYLTAGIGPLQFASYTVNPAPATAPPSQMTLNMGGGARWFAASHLAFTFDVRFYQTRPEVRTGAYAARERRQLLVLSAGVAFR